jgi:protocatechuate 3,4-dioxygenase beta subunit
MQERYPDPFVQHPELSALCALAVATTGGPCTEAADRERRDISEGYQGLPMRMAFKIVDVGCRPLANAKVKVWHTQQNGRYSGDTPAAMCLADPSERTRHYFRGVQRTDANGRVDFNSCFPGWYPGRAVHVHLEVQLNGRSYVTQVGFEQALCNELFESHPDYRSFGQPDTRNEDDGIIGGDQLHSFVAHTERLPDGVLMAAKQIVVRL